MTPDLAMHLNCRRSEVLANPEAAFANIHYRILKPGGAFLAIDHIAAPGSGGGTLHGTREVIITGHLLVLRSSPLLYNADDPLDFSVFDASIQRNTTKFAVLFRR